MVHVRFVTNFFKLDEVGRQVSVASRGFASKRCRLRRTFQKIGVGCVAERKLPYTAKSAKRLPILDASNLMRLPPKVLVQRSYVQQREMPSSFHLMFLRRSRADSGCPSFAFITRSDPNSSSIKFDRTCRPCSVGLSFRRSFRLASCHQSGGVLVP